MGHLLSKNGYRLKKRTRKLRKKKKKRNCFLQGPCMLCFIVHGNSGSLDDDPFESSSSAAIAATSKLAECYASSLASPEDCARFLLPSRADLALWESQTRVLLSAATTDNGGGGEGPGAPPADGATQRLLPLCTVPSSMLPSSSSSSLEDDSFGPGQQAGCGEGVIGTGSAAATSSASVCQNHAHSVQQDECQRPSEVTDSSSVNHLPSSILLKIFSHLSVKERCLCASLVCKYWRDLCLDFQLWKQIDLSGLQQVNDELLVKIASRRQHVTELNLSDCRNVQDHGVCALASHCPGLLKYTAYRCKQLSDLSLCTIATHCPLLAKVHVGNQDKLTDHALRLLGEHCSELKDIHLGQCYNITDDGMVALARGCPKLQRIYMQENKLVTDKSVRAFAEHCPELQFVGFMGCSVTSQGVIHLTRLRNLTSLDLRHISELNNETVMEVVRKCRSLSSLNLCLNWSINDRCVEIIAKEGRSLKELYLVSCKITDYALIAIGQYSSSIETVDAGWCKDITDQGATQIAQNSKSLRYLGLMRCDKVNEETVERLVLQYPHIVFSTVMQDCKRTLERAYQMGWSPNTSTGS
ncbi:F-box/LRR-repeat protein 17 isoform X2 [Denticeps clupeoides]|uniref:F-box/LRR-repeat protein 17 isoform X2 n=1 Tax=Denticeps clupeoides TaxID=299321 RepID=UPI0010A35AE8|nr:F-box/LRR-repeat protein 17 isoform X2 [Denticeps clupeoides]